MQHKPLIWHIFPTYLLVILIALIAITGYTARSMESFYQQHVAADLEVRARIIEKDVLSAYGKGPEAFQRLCREMGRDSAARITVVSTDGQVMGDSEQNPAEMENHAARPEIQQALRKGLGNAIRYSATLKRKMLYVAVPLRDGENTIGILRLAEPVARLSEALWGFRMRMAYAGFAVALFAAAISWIVCRRLSRSLAQIREGAQRFSRGDFSQELPIPNPQEFAQLSEAMNQMARHLDDRIRAVINQRNQFEAILSSMVEGVLAVDTEKRIISINRAAARTVGVQVERALGQSSEIMITNAELRQFISDALSSSETTESEFVIPERDQQILQVHGTVLRDSEGRNIGAVVALNDVTRLRRLEQVRRDFVANVSHELRTPITSIKGFVETLLDGALNDPSDARRFLEIVAKQSDRLNAILGDLLTLSQIEEGEHQAEIALEAGGLREVLQAAVQLCETKAQEKMIDIDLTCDDGLRVQMNAPLLEQAITNLVDNAIKYSDVGGQVRILAVRDRNGVHIQVSDDGCGIPAEHLPRLFERFYRVDKARSRNLGGTGLGLAIVKHIAKAHHGRVTVESIPGKGSSFQFSVPD